MVSTWKSLFLVISLFAFGLAYPSDTNTTDTPKDDDDNDERIVRGQPAQSGQFPWQVAMHFNDGVFCGGSLIEYQYVLTAAHCTYGRAAGNVILGALVWTDGSATRIPIEYTVSHPSYKPPSLQHDIGIVKMKYAASKTNTIRTIPVAPSNSFLNPGDIVFVSGYGADKNQGSTNSRLNYASLKTISNAECDRLNGGTLPAGNVCAQGQNKESTCSGDSGGPLVQNMNGEWKVVGVVSYVVNGCENGNPAGFIRVPSYLPFIRGQTGVNYP